VIFYALHRRFLYIFREGLEKLYHQKERQVVSVLRLSVFSGYVFTGHKQVDLVLKTCRMVFRGKSLVTREGRDLLRCITLDAYNLGTHGPILMIQIPLDSDFHCGWNCNVCWSIL